MGEADAFANQVRFAYATMLRNMPRGPEGAPRKKVLIFSLSYFPNVGGAEVAIGEITRRIPEIEFHMITRRFDSTLPAIEKIGNVLVHRIGFTKRNPSPEDMKRFPLSINKYAYQILAPLKALSLNRVYRYDAVWAMMAHAVGIGTALFKLSHPAMPYVLSLQEGDPPEYIERLARPAWPLFKYAFTSADRVQVISNFLGEWAKRMGYRGEPVLIPNGVETKHFAKKYPDAALSELTQALGKKKDEVYLVTTSRLVHKNAIDDVIRALPLLPKKVHFLVLGKGPDGPGLRQLAKQEGVSERVHFLGQVEHEELPRYLQISDIFIRPSRSEGMGNSFIEAFAAGLPVIATQEGGLADFIRPGENAWAVVKDSPEQIAEAVKDVMAHPAEAKKVAARAKALALAEYDWDTIAAAMREKVFSVL
jgi:glycosyltransferase involved in cell wall biosynthesis